MSALCFLHSVNNLIKTYAYENCEVREG